MFFRHAFALLVGSTTLLLATSAAAQSVSDTAQQTRANQVNRSGTQSELLSTTSRIGRLNFRLETRLPTRLATRRASAPEESRTAATQFNSRR